MHSQDLRTFISAVHYLCHIFQRIGEHFLTLSDRSRKERCHTLVDNILYPIAKSLFFRIVRIKSISPVAVDIDKSRKDPVASVILIHRLCSILIDINDFPVFYFNLSFHKLVRKPYFFTLNDHNNTSCLFPGSIKSRILIFNKTCNII